MAPKQKLGKKIALSIAALLLCGLLFGAYRLSGSASKFPLADVQRKDFVDYVEVKGEVKALRSVNMVAPSSAGDLQIIKLADNGAKVKKGDLIVEFDTTSAKQKLAQDQSVLKSADAEIQQAKANARLKEEQDLTDVMTAKYDAERARMDVGKQEILSAIQGEQAKLKLSDAEQKLKEMQAKLDANRLSAKADLATRQQKRNQAAFQVTQDERSLDFLILHAPLDGVVAVQNHWQPPNGMAPFHPGDRAWPGQAIAELPDPSSIKITARVEEADRGRLQLGQAANVRVDAVPDQSFDGKVDTISPTASLDFNAGWPVPRNFALELSLAKNDPRLVPGMSATIRIVVDRVQNGIVIPSSALFRKSGRNVTYVRSGSKFEEVDVDVLRRSGDEVLISKGLKPGDKLALKDPTLTE